LEQLGLLLALQLLGSAACQAAGIGTWLSQALGFVVGLALAVVLALPALLLGQFTVAIMAGVLAASLMLLVWIAIRRHRMTARPAIVTLGWALAFTAACVPFVLHDVSVMTYDSHVFVRYAGMLRDSHELVFDKGVDFHSRGIFQIVGHALSLFTGDPFLTALTPAFSLSLGATFVLALERGLRDKVSARARWIAIAIAVVALLAIPLVRVHVVYIHTNWASAGYWFVFAALFCLAELEQDKSYLPIAFLALLAYALNRVENPLFAAVFLAVAGAATRFDRRALAWPLVAFTLLLVGWLSLLVSILPEDSLHLTPTKGLLMIAALVAIAIACLLRDVPLVRRLFTPPVIAIAIGVGVLAIVAIRFDAFVQTFGNWQADLWLHPYWGYVTWPLLAILGLGCFWVEQPSHTRGLRYALAMFFALVILLAALAPAAYYHTGRYGDLTRISVHVVPLLVFYFALVFTPVVAAKLRR
jgi:hypothetical protein